VKSLVRPGERGPLALGRQPLQRVADMRREIEIARDVEREIVRDECSASTSTAPADPPAVIGTRSTSLRSVEVRYTCSPNR